MTRTYADKKQGAAKQLAAKLAEEHRPVLRAMCRQLRSLGQHPARVIALMAVLDGTMNPARHADVLRPWLSAFAAAAEGKDGDRRKHIMSRKAAVEWAIAELDGQAGR